MTNSTADESQIADPRDQYPSRRARREAESRHPRHPKRPRARTGSPRRRALPGVGLVLAAALLGTYALPAYATTPGSVVRKSSPVHRGAQVLVAPAGTSSPIARDKYAVANPPKPRPAFSSALAEMSLSNPTGAAIRWPLNVSAPISDGFGYRIAPCSGCSSFHEGIDINPGAGTPVYAIAAGVVKEVGNPSGALGVYAIIDHQIDGKTVSSIYAHMQLGSLALSVGQSVAVGQPVGRVGSTGASTGPHLHLGIMVEGAFVDPYAWLMQRVG